MKIAVFSTKPHDRNALDQANARHGHELVYLEPRLVPETAALARLRAASARDVTVTRVPAYSPHAVAEHALGLILTLSRKLHRAYARVREGNFSLDGLLGFDLHGKTVGVVGTGRIGTVFCRIHASLGCRILAHDPFPSDEVRSLGARYVALDELWPAADIVALHLPLTPETHHLIDDAVIARMKDGVMLITEGSSAVGLAR